MRPECNVWAHVSAAGGSGWSEAKTGDSAVGVGKASAALYFYLCVRAITRTARQARHKGFPSLLHGLACNLAH